MWLFFFFFSSRRRHTRLVSDWSSDVCSSDLAKIEGLVKDLKDAVASEDFDKMKSLKDEIQQAFYAISQALYQDAGGGMPDMGDMGGMGGPGGEAPSDSSGGDDDVIDAEFSEPEK